MTLGPAYVKFNGIGDNCQMLMWKLLAHWAPDTINSSICLGKSDISITFYSSLESDSQIALSVFLSLSFPLFTSVTAVVWKITLSDVCLLCRLEVRSRLSPLSFLSLPLSKLCPFASILWPPSLVNRCVREGSERAAARACVCIGSFCCPFHAILTRLCQSWVRLH